jgi:hypothetical protein
MKYPGKEVTIILQDVKIQVSNPVTGPVWLKGWVQL